MRAWQWLVYGLVMLLVCIPLAALADGLFRGWLRSTASVVIDDSLASYTSANHDTLIVYLPGILADGEWSARQLTDTWRFYGDVWLVSYNGQRFFADQVVDAVAKRLANDHHSRVVFIGSSMGALLASDILAKLPASNASYALLLVCAPTGRTDLKAPLNKASSLLRVVRFGPGANLVLSRTVMKLLVGEQPRQFDMTYYADQVRYIINHPGVDAQALAGVELRYLQADRDEMVGRQAYQSWEEQTHQVIRLVRVDSIHAGYDADPTVWNNVFRVQLMKLALGN